MKFIKGLLYSILVLLSLISLFIIICAFQPALSAKVASFFQNKLGNSSPYREETAQEDMLPMPEEGDMEDGIETGNDNNSGINGAVPTASTDSGENETLDELLGGNHTSGYVAPEREEVNVPESVTGLGGFTPVQEVAEEIDEKEAEVIRRIYKLCAAGYGSRTIANVLEKEGIVSTAGKIMNASTIRRMIRNPLYKGTFVMNKKHFDFSTKRTIKNPESEWIYDDSLVPAIVEEELWEEANRAISMRAEKGCQNEEYVRENVKGSNPGKYSLSGKLICGVCGRPYYRSWRRKKSEPGKTIYEWKCSGYINYGRNGKKRRDGRRKALFPDGERGCDNSHLNEEIVFGMLKQCSSMYFQMKREEKDGIIETTIRLLGQVLVQSPREIRMETLEKEVLELERKKKLLLDKLLDGIVSDEDYRKRNKDLEEKLEKTLEEQEQCRIPSVQQKNMENRLMEIKERLEHGGLERAAAERLLDDIDKIVVHEWQLEFRFHPFHMPGIPVGESGETGQAVKEDEKMVSLFLNYPFPSDTEKGRFLDRQKLMEWIKEYPSFTVKQYAEKMGRSPYMVQNRMNELRKAGYIEFRKSGRDGRWVIIKKLPGGGVDE